MAACVVVPGEPTNRKITDPADLDWARADLASLDAAPEAVG